jgi:hypothetical protein
MKSARVKNEEVRKRRMWWGVLVNELDSFGSVRSLNSLTQPPACSSHGETR